MMLASYTSTPELVIDESESKALAKAIAEVSNQYGGVPLSPAQMAWFGLIQAAGMVYGPRLFAYSARKKSEPRKQRAPQSQAPQPEPDGGFQPTILDLGA